MIDFFKKSVTWAMGFTTLIFTFIPETYFEKIQLLKNFSVEKNIVLNHILTFIWMLILVIITHIIYLYCRKSIIINGHNYKIKVEYGDLFAMTECKKVINFDECFTTSVGEAPADIKPTSICGQYLKMYPDLDVEKLIKNSNMKAENEGSKYKGKKKYESGKLLSNGDDLLMAFAKLDADGSGRFFSYKELLDCLFLLWKEIDKYYGQKDVCIPILGSGLTRINEMPLTQQELLDIIISSYKLSSHKIKLPYKLHIVCKKNDGFSLNKIGNFI